MSDRAPRAGATRLRLGALALAAALPFALAAIGCAGHDADDEEEERPVSAPPRLTTEQGRVAVTLDPATLARSGVTVETLPATAHAASATSFGSVLDLTDLAQMRGAFVAAAAALDKARAALAASRAELERLRTLYAGDRNASQKALQAATAKAMTDEADVRAAEGTLEAQRALAGQRWGFLVAGWLERGDPRLAALLAQKDRLVEVTMPPGSTPLKAAAAVMIQAGTGLFLEAHVVSPAPRADPRIQGASVLCIAPATPEMLPGMTVTARVPVGRGSPGVVIPPSAVVWWQGRAWVYVEIGQGTFVRREVATDNPVPGGWFVSTGLGPGDRVVVRGAQLLLSEEGRGAVRGSEG